MFIKEAQAQVYYWDIPLSTPSGEPFYPHCPFMTNMSVTPNQYPIIGIEALKGGGGFFLVIGLWGCAGIFTTSLTIVE